ncbi:unnamed protein product [Blepharisma stoltei]|uniref:Sel1 repeat family protein n=1 Tax=Blepharisma stoltei TaxID=1481888 RepID=A0AAU9IYM3_9CILI|nr:unnamed protein product [Blepharisma stoltei]
MNRSNDSITDSQPKSKSLGKCLQKHLNKWMKEYKTQAEEGNTEAMIIYSKLLRRGMKNQPPDIPHALYWLRKAARTSSLAAFQLGKIYIKDKYVDMDLDKAYFYFRLALTDSCDCGDMADLLHSHRISEVHSCIYNDSQEYIKQLGLSDFEIKRLEDRFLLWRKSSS